MSRAGLVRVSVDPDLLAGFIVLQGRRFVSVSSVAFMLGTSTRTAGRLLAMLERKGYVRRYSRHVYEVIAGPDRV